MEIPLIPIMDIPLIPIMPPIIMPPMPRMPIMLPPAAARWRWMLAGEKKHRTL
jgi:hypothetical protein